MSDAPYSVLTLDQSMTSTAWAHHLKGERVPSGGLLPLPSWGDDQGRHLEKFHLWLKDMLWDRQVTHLSFEEPIDPSRLKYGETFDQILAKYGLPAIIELTAHQGGIAPENRLMIPQTSWRENFWGRGTAPKGLTDGARRSWLKAQSIAQCHARGWDCQHDGRDNHNIADAKGILNFTLICIDPRWAANSGPLFRRAQLRAENEDREMRS